MQAKKSVHQLNSIVQRLTINTTLYMRMFTHVNIVLYMHSICGYYLYNHFLFLQKKHLIKKKQTGSWNTGNSPCPRSGSCCPPSRTSSHWWGRWCPPAWTAPARSRALFLGLVFPTAFCKGAFENISKLI